MNVGDETARTVYDFPVDLDEKEMMFFFEYARDNISEDEFEQLMVEWAMVKIVEKSIKENLKIINNATEVDLKDDYYEYYTNPDSSSE